jgi:ribonucleotide reductase alpha subunit
MIEKNGIRNSSCTSLQPTGCRPYYALTTTENGILTLDELFKDHQENEKWSDLKDNVEVVQQGCGFERDNKIIRTFNNGLSKIFKIKLSHGFTLESTSEHKWFVKYRMLNNRKEIKINDWVKTKDLQKGDVIDTKVGLYKKLSNSKLNKINEFAIKMKGKHNPINQPEYINRDLAWMLGYLWGDGAMSPGSYRIRFTDGNNYNLNRVNIIIKEIFGIEGIIKKDKRENANELCIANKMLWHWLIKNNFWKYFEDKIDVIPIKIRQSSFIDIIAFIAGLLDSDGCVSENYGKTKIRITSADKMFIEHLQHVSLSVGLCFGLSKNKEGKNYQKNKCIYTLTLSAAHSLEDSVGLLENFSNKIKNYKKHNIFNWKANDRNRGAHRLGKIKDIELLEKNKYTYDVEVENHWYYAGSFKSHNSTSRLVDSYFSIEPIFAATVESKLNDRKQINVIPEKYINHPNLVTIKDLTAEQHIKMVAAFQKHTDSGISKTCNLPYEATKEDVSQAMMMAYDMKLKAITVYRDNSRKEQVLNKINNPECKNGLCEI